MTVIEVVLLVFTTLLYVVKCHAGKLLFSVVSFSCLFKMLRLQCHYQ